MSDYICSFKMEDENFRVWSRCTKKTTTMPIFPPGDRKLRKFIMLNCKDNEATDEFLEEYSKDFK